MDREEFNIMLQANFVDAHDRAKVLSVIGSMKMDNSGEGRKDSEPCYTGSVQNIQRD